MTAAEIATLVGATPGLLDDERIDFVISVPDLKSALLINRLRPGADIEVLSRRGGRRAYLFAFDAAHEDRLLGFLPFTIVLSADAAGGRPLYEIAIHDLAAAEPGVRDRATTALSAGLCRTVVQDLEDLVDRLDGETFRMLTCAHSINTHVMPDPSPIIRLCDRIHLLFRGAVERGTEPAPRPDLHIAA